ncbi:D-sorbitol dehydrogenase (acceptor) [Kaistia soli DSM 19436]|uniref:D-sorbitol dehydrogenase (Acceptor) n=1 Tax=Kaistia soli DSM 19436 TaxID=1122133 RepID=A0A1M4X911_9HYPH|nr:SDR family oxidoreductase [Kaistia soli]SHE89984.1 D-sorbitol dehydrogenase (acceptor) [Kaistia soli DSM 19436]
MSKYMITAPSAPLPVRTPRILPVHEGKSFVVTGGSGGIGKAIAGLLLAQGAHVVVADLKPASAEATAEELGGAGKGCFAVAMDVGSQSSVAAGIDAAAAALGTIDGLVNCAAIVLHSDPLEISWDDWRRQFEINLFGAYEASRLVAKRMIDAGTRGAIVSIASEAGKKGHKESLAYSASKAALISMTRMLSETLAPHDINVNCVCPGGVATPMLREVSEAYSGFTGEGAPAIFDKMLSQQLIRHLQPIEVARVTSFLLTDDAMLIRGQAVNADAGETPY